MAKFTEQQLQNLRQARQHLIACKKQLEGAKTHLQQFLALVKPFGMNIASFEKMLNLFGQCEAGLSQAQQRVEQQLPDRDREMKITISEQKLEKDPFLTPDMLKWILAALALSLPGIWLMKWFIDFVTGK